MTHPAINIDRIPPEARLELIGDLWDSLRAQPDTVPMPEAHRIELDRRLDEIGTGQATLVSWEDAKLRMGVPSE